jgi:predicted nucleotidyltransferase
MTPPIDIPPQHFETVKSILRAALPPGATAFVFGSRATGATKPSSDLDLAIDAGRPLTPTEHASLTDAFEDRDLPYKVDVVDCASATKEFRSIIDQNKVIVQYAGSHSDTN